MSEHSVVIIGGGFAGVYCAMELLKRAIPVTLVSETSHFTFTPLLHEVATGTLVSRDASFPYESFFRSQKFRFIRGKVTGVDRASKSITVGDTTLSYQYLVVATGSTTNFYTLKGTDHAYTLKTIEDAMRLKKAILIRAQDIDRHVAITVVGGGPTGLELIFDLAQMLKSLKRKNRSAKYALRLVHASDVFCKAGGERLQAYISRALKRAKIEVVCNARAQGITEDEVHTSAGDFHSDVTVLCAGVRPNTDVFKHDLTLDERGHIVVHPSLQSVEDEHIFSIGDVIAIENEPVPKLAQTAVQEAPIVAANISRLLKTEKATLKSYRPKVLGMLFSLGYGNGVGTIGPVMVKGVFAWYLWRTVYLFKTPGLGNKLRVAFSWTIGLFQGRDLSEY
jgi:NADH:ubiquinone reductase (H+-translocating)